MEKIDPFDELNKEDQGVAIDVAVATILIGTRLPAAGKPLYDYIAGEFAASRTLPSNKVKYALRSLAEALMDQNWVLTITKKDNTFTSQFSSEPINGVDGEEKL